LEKLEEALFELMDEFLEDLPQMEESKEKIETVTKVTNVLKALPDKKMAAHLAAKLINEANSADEDPIIKLCTEFLEKRALREPDEEETTEEQKQSETEEKDRGETSSH
jgi:hypothetical protein